MSNNLFKPILLTSPKGGYLPETSTATLVNEAAYSTASDQPLSFYYVVPNLMIRPHDLHDILSGMLDVASNLTNGTISADDIQFLVELCKEMDAVYKNAIDNSQNRTEGNATINFSR